LGRRWLFRIAAVGATFLACGTSAAQGVAPEAFTIPEILSAPFPTELVAAPSKPRFAWVFDAQGVRNIWMAERKADGGYASRALTHYTEDDGQDLGQIGFTSDSEAVVFVRAGDLEFLNSPDTNPVGLAEPEKQAVWLQPVGGGNPRKVGEGHSPAVSPQGDSIAYISKGQIWIARLADAASSPTLAVNARGTASALRWSPSGDRLAFTSNRDDHSFIGIYSPATRSVRYVDPSTDFDSDAVWSPDGTQIAFLRRPWSREDSVDGPHREGRPWSIRVSALPSGKTSEIWRAPNGVGSEFHAIEVPNQLFWAAGGRLVFPAELDGWTRLYAVSSQGGAAKPLMEGESEVEFAALSPDRQTIVLSSNEGDSERRHLWRASVDGTQPFSVTKGEGVETAPVFSFDGQDIAFFQSKGMEPTFPALKSSIDPIVKLAPGELPPTFPIGKLVAPLEVRFPAADGTSLHGQLFMPPGSGKGKRPALLFLHGGPMRQMLPAFHYMHYYSNTYALNQYLASRGFVVLALNYRLGIGYGLDFREATNGGPAGASEFSDVIGAGLYLRSRPEVDPTRIGLWGGSYGGYLTALGLARASNLFAAGVDFHGVHEWPHHDFAQRGGAASYEFDVDHDRVRLAFASSPVADVKTWRSPVLLIHGDDDRNVAFSETVRLVDALRRQGVDVEQLVFPDEIHDFLIHRHVIEAYQATADFFVRQLAQREITSKPRP
jgi:dipeptidyl aminopeptidase/acylaminoacyl peptidase